MPSFPVQTPQRCYAAVVERGVLARAADYLPNGCGKVFVVSTEDVWRHQGAAIEQSLAAVHFERLFLPGGE